MKPPKGFRWVRVGEWLRSNDAFFSELEEGWTPRWNAHVSNYTLRPVRCCTPQSYVRAKRPDSQKNS